jgi:hypothetical protein
VIVLKRPERIAHPPIIDKHDRRCLRPKQASETRPQ